MAINYDSPNGNFDGVVDASAAATKAIYGSGNTTITVYTITDTLNISGTFTDNLSNKMVIFSGTSRTGMFNVLGDVTIEGNFERLGFTIGQVQAGLYFALTSASLWNRGEMRLVGGGSLTIRNCFIKGAISYWFGPNANGRVLFEDVTIDKEGVTGDVQTNVSGFKKNITFRRVTHYVYGQTGITLRDNVAGDGSAPHLIANEVFQARDAWNNEGAATMIVEGLVPETGSTVDIAHYAGRSTWVKNPTKGTEFIWGGHLANSPRNTGVVEVSQELKVTAVDSAGQPLEDVSYHLEDDPAEATTRVLEFDNRPANEKRVYNGTFATELVLDILIGEGQRTVGGAQIVGGDSNKVRARGTVGPFGDDTYSLLYRKPGYQEASVNVVLKTPQEIKIELRIDEAYDAALPGANVTGIAIAGDTITIDESVTLQELYNFIRYFLSLPANLSLVDFLSTPNGVVILDGYNVTVVSGGTLAPDDNFTGIQSNLQVLAEGTGQITCTIQDANGDSLLRFQAPEGVDTFSIHTTLSDADDNLNPLVSGGFNMRYVAAAVAGNRFLRATGGDTELVLPILIQATPGIYDEAVLVTEATVQLSGLETTFLRKLDSVESVLGSKIDNVGGGGGGGSSTASTNILVG